MNYVESSNKEIPPMAYDKGIIISAVSEPTGVFAIAFCANCGSSWHNTENCPKG